MKELKKDPVKLFLILELGICYLLGLLELFFKNGLFYGILGAGFPFFPAICAAISRRITGAKAKYPFSLKVWENQKAWLFSAVVPGVLGILGAVLYFTVFPKEYSGVLKYGRLLGTEAELSIPHPLVLACVLVVLGAVMIPVQLLALGEEAGWRGWLLGFQAGKDGERKAVLINGFEWGVSHLPLIYFGFNYSLNNPGAPWTNMLMMVLVCIVLGTVFSYVTLRTENCMYAAVMHGVVNTIGALPVYLTFRMESNLLGPNATGLLGLTFLMMLAIGLWFHLKSKRRIPPR